LVGFAILFIFLCFFRPKRNPWAVTCILVLAAAIDLKAGIPVAWIWAEGFTAVPPRVALDVQANDLSSFDKLRTDYRDATLPLGDVFSVGIVPNWYYQQYIDFLDRTKTEVAARQQLLGVTRPEKLFFSSQLVYDTVQGFLSGTIPFTYDIIAYDGDQLIVNVEASQAGYLSFIDNWDPDWVVLVDGTPKEIELLFGTFKSVALSEGTHRVVFAYRPEIMGIPLAWN
jgi:hypothetical protein